MFNLVLPAWELYFIYLRLQETRVVLRLDYWDILIYAVSYVFHKILFYYTHVMAFDLDRYIRLTMIRLLRQIT